MAEAGKARGKSKISVDFRYGYSLFCIALRLPDSDTELE